MKVTGPGPCGEGEVLVGLGAPELEELGDVDEAAERVKGEVLSSPSEKSERAGDVERECAGESGGVSRGTVAG